MQSVRAFFLYRGTTVAVFNPSGNIPDVNDALMQCAIGVVRSSMFENSMLQGIPSGPLDGFLARTMNWQTRLGTILDPVADKLLLSGTIFIFWLNELIPFYIFIIFISRDIAILLGAAIQMSLIDTDTPLPNFLGKLTDIP